MTRLHGKSGLVLVGPTQGAAATPVAYLSHWDIDWVPDQIEVTARGDGTTRWLAGMDQAAGTFAGFFDDASSQLYTQARDGLPRNFYLYPASAEHDRYFGGLITVTSFVVSGAVADAVAITGSWVAAGEVDSYVTDFVIPVTASIHGSGSVAVLPPGTTLISGQSAVACTPIIGATANIAGSGQCGAIPRAAYLNGVGVASLVTPILAPSPLPVAGRGVVTARPVISDTPQAAGQGVVTIPGKITGAAVGDGEAIAAPTVSVKAVAAGAGVAGSGFSQAIGAKAAIAGAGTAGTVPVHSAVGVTAAGTGAAQATKSSGGVTIAVTATQGGSTLGGLLLRIFVLTGAANTAGQLGATATAQFTTGTTAWTRNITTTQTGSRVYGTSDRGPTAGAATANGSTTVLDDHRDNVSHNVAYTDFKATSLTGTPGAITIGFTAASDFGVLVMGEVKANGTLTEDASAPAAVYSATATTLTSASFSPPSGSLVLVLVASDGGSGGVTTMTVGDGGTLTWNEQLKLNPTGYAYAGIWTADVP